MNHDTIETAKTIAFALGTFILFTFIRAAFFSSPSTGLRKRREQALAGLGFTVAHYPRFQAHLEGQPVQVELGDVETRLIVGWPPRSGLLLARGPARDPIGDPDFDRQIDTRGSAVHALAWLSAAERETLAHANSLGWELSPRGLERMCRWDDAAELGALLQPGLVAARALPRRRLTLVEGFLERLANDPHVGVRRRALEEIIKRADADDDELARAVALCQKDPDPELRMFAARRDADPATLSSIALANTAAPTLRAEALSILLSRRLDHLVTDDLLGRLLRHVDGQAAPGLDPESAIAMVRAMGPHLDVSDAERAAHLRAILEAALRGPAPLAIAAIDTLAAHGGLWAVPHLIPLRDKRLPDVLKAAATRAIDFIQARAGGDAGALSLTAEGGALALSEES